MWSIFLLCCVIAAAGAQSDCGDSGVKLPTAVNGRFPPNYALHGQWPWLVMVGRRAMGWCTGVVVNEQLVLTSARCARSTSDLSLFKIMAAKVNLAESRGSDVYRSVKSVKIHPDYNAAKRENDIALLELNKPIVFNDNVFKICLPEQDVPEFEVGQQCFTAGWGATKELTNFSELQYMSNTIVKADQCGASANSKQHFCWGADQQCAGQLDGPLMCANKATNNWFVLAGFSTGTGRGGECGKHTGPHLFTKITKQTVQWIDKVLIGQ